MQLFNEETTLPDHPAVSFDRSAFDTPGSSGRLMPAMDQYFMEVFEKANNPSDPFELRDLWVGRVEEQLPGEAHTSRVELWRKARRQRNYGESELLGMPSVVSFVKELFNFYFRDDLYGRLYDERHSILSSGSLDETEWGLPEVLKHCIQYSLGKDWYGYSDSRGRVSSLQAISRLENAKMRGDHYSHSNIAITMGATFAINTMVDFLAQQFPGQRAPALCGVPNYPPLVQSVANRFDTNLVPLESVDGITYLAKLKAALTPQTPLIMIQTALNPNGSVVDENELAELIRMSSPNTYIILDESHEWLGPPIDYCKERSNDNVIRVTSMSKTYSAPGLKVGWIIASAPFIKHYYEYASTSFGGPPSVFYTMIEVMANMERWHLENVEKIDDSHVSEFENSYGLTVPNLDRAYRSFIYERTHREKNLYDLRQTTVDRLHGGDVQVIGPRYSVNVTVNLKDQHDSYKAFREILHHSGVSVYPGILNFFFSGCFLRLSPMKKPEELDLSLKKLTAYLKKEYSTH